MMSGCPSAHHLDGSCHSNGSPESVSVPHPMRGKEREGCDDMMSEERLYNRDNLKLMPYTTHMTNIVMVIISASDPVE